MAHFRENHEIKDVFYVVECGFHSSDNVESLKVLNSGSTTLFNSGLLRCNLLTAIHPFQCRVL